MNKERGKKNQKQNESKKQKMGFWEENDQRRGGDGGRLGRRKNWSFWGLCIFLFNGFYIFYLF